MSSRVNTLLALLLSERASGLSVAGDQGLREFERVFTLSSIGQQGAGED